MKPTTKASKNSGGSNIASSAPPVSNLQKISSKDKIRAA